MTSISNDILGRVGNTHGGLSATLWSVLPLQQGIRTTPTLPTARRRLEGESSSYLVDEDGNEYEPYSLAWRYLGLFLDCQDKDSSNQQDGRKLNNEDNENQDTSQCLRKVLWAAYHDPNYSGGSIGEYQIFDLQTQSYADFNCHAERCVKMDCHESISQNFELVGVFKETDGLEVFTEQLFKHQGYCLWNENQYEFMQTYQSYIPTYCQQLYYADDDSRNNLWIHVEPQPYGKAGIGVYTDDTCSTKSQTTSLEEYIRMFYEQEEGGDNDNDNKNNNNANGRQVAKAWIQALKKWNEMMNIYKTCRPCRAYNLHIGGNGDYNNNDANQGRQRQRQLNEDGEGDEEQWGYDCYDDAGYLNCNQVRSNIFKSSPLRACRFLCNYWQLSHPFHTAFEIFSATSSKHKPITNQSQNMI